MTTVKTCANCAYWHPQHQACVLFKAKRNPEEDTCSSHTTEPLVCAICQSYIIGQSFLYTTPNRYVEVCAQCKAAIPTCAGCKRGAKCEFEQNPDPLPKIVLHQFQQGNATVQAQIRNPERVKRFCLDCPCWCMEDYTCNRDFNCCGNYQCVFDP